MKIRSLALALTLAAAPLPLLAQTTPAPDAPRREVRDGARMQRAPLERLVAQRERLGLTAEQVTRLKAVQERLRSRNAPLLEQVRTARRQAVPRQPGTRAPLTEQERDALRRTREALRPVREQLRENRRGAAEEVRAILTDEQRTRLRELRREGRRGRDGRHARPGHRGGRRGS